MAKEVLFNEDVWSAIKRGIDTVANSVSSTLGPRGRNVIITQGVKPVITNDGVTVAKSIQLKDEKENIGAQLLIEVASKANDVAGDGTTTATLLGQAIFNKGLKYLLAGANPLKIKKGIDIATASVVEYLKKEAKPVETKEDITKVATISANNDKELGELIADAISRVGKDGVITVEESKGMDTYTDVVEGMQFNKGYLSPYFITNVDKQTVEMKEPVLLFTDLKLNSMQDLVPLLNQVVQSKRPLVLIADEIGNEVLSNLVLNKMRGVFSVVALQAPMFGDKRKEMLQDLSILCGGTYVTSDLGMKLDNLTLENLGQASSINVSKDETTIVGGLGDKAVIEEHIEKLKASLDVLDTDYEKEKVRERIARLVGGVAVIYAGATTETELKEKKMRIEDALCATKASYEEGIVLGGGIALLNASVEADIFSNKNILDSDIEIGVNIIKNSIVEPFNKILNNAGVSSDVVADRVLSFKGMPTVVGEDELTGFDANSGEYVNMVQQGIVDPVKVTRSALQNASSIAGLLLTTGCMISEIKEEKSPQALPPMGMM